MADKTKAAITAAQPEHDKGKEKITQFQIIYDCFSTGALIKQRREKGQFKRWRIVSPMA